MGEAKVVLEEILDEEAQDEGKMTYSMEACTPCIISSGVACGDVATKRTWNSLSSFFLGRAPLDM